MDPLYVNVNQGSYGCTPTKVRHVTEALVRETEWNPDLWFRFNISGDGDSHMTAMLARTRAFVAAYIGANVEDTVLVDNASHGIAAVLRSIFASSCPRGSAAALPRPRVRLLEGRARVRRRRRAVQRHRSRDNDHSSSRSRPSTSSPA